MEALMPASKLRLPLGCSTPSQRRWTSPRSLCNSLPVSQALIISPTLKGEKKDMLWLVWPWGRHLQLCEIMTKWMPSPWGLERHVSVYCPPCRHFPGTSRPVATAVWSPRVPWASCTFTDKAYARTWSLACTAWGGQQSGATCTHKGTWWHSTTTGRSSPRLWPLPRGSTCTFCSTLLDW